MSFRSIIPTAFGVIAVALLLSSSATNAATVVQEAYLKASNTGFSDNFGRGVAASGNTIVVGAPGEGSNASGVNGNQLDDSLTSSGAAYVFVRDGAGNWSQQAYLKASDPAAGAQFGWSVAISGDTIVVGAFTAGPLETGVAYVFTRDGAGNWSQQGRLTASNAQFDDQFGISVAISGDTIVVGANREDSNAAGVNGDSANNSLSEAGAAYVFTRDGVGNWSEQAYIKASNTGSIDNFGASVSISGDTLVVGALGEASNATGVNGNQADNSVNGAGAAYVFVRSSTGDWSQQAYLKPSSAASNFENFGVSVSISGDTVGIGSQSEDSGSFGINGDESDNSTSGAGAAYVFVRDGAGTWTQQAYIKASNTDSNDNFGVSVAVLGDQMAVAASSEGSSATGINGDQSDNSAGGSGAAYAFTRDGTGTWSQAAYLKASNTEGGDIFGISVAASGDTAVVGALREDSDATGVNGNQANNNKNWAGAAYAFASVPSFSVGGSVSGLVGSGLVLQNDNGDDRAITSNGPFTFPTELIDGASYDVTVQSEPTGPNQICEIANGTGTINASDVTNIQVTCATNQPPIAVDDSGSVDEDSSVTIAAAGNDSDIDGNLDSASTNLSCGACTMPANGGLVNNGDGTFEYTPDADFFGSDAFVYEICDTDGECDTATVDITIDPVNDPPVFTAGPDPLLPVGAAGPQSFPGWPQSVDLGPGETQAIDSYAVTTVSDPDGILSGAATISNGGELGFTLTGASGSAQMEATLADDGGTLNGGDDTSAPVAFTITVEPPAADLAARFVLCTSRAAPDEAFAYSLQVDNLGPDDAENSALTHDLPLGSSVTTIGSPDCVDNGDRIDCDLGSIAAGAQWTTGVELTMPDVGGQLLPAAVSVAAGTADPSAGNNDDAVDVEIVPGLVNVDGFESCTP